MLLDRYAMSENKTAFINTFIVVLFGTLILPIAFGTTVDIGLFVIGVVVSIIYFYNVESAK